MSTRCLIAIEDGDGSCRAIYCHHDGYVEGVGAVLKDRYKTREEIESLFSLGDLSSLGETPKECYAYHRDGGEELQEPRVWKNREEIVEKAWDVYWAEYVYLFTRGEWIMNPCYGSKEWKQV